MAAADGPDHLFPAANKLFRLVIFRFCLFLREGMWRTEAWPFTGP